MTATEPVLVLTFGVHVEGVFTTLDNLRPHLPEGVELRPCPNPDRGWNVYRGPSGGWIGTARWAHVDATPEEADARARRAVEGIRT